MKPDRGLNGNLNPVHNKITSWTTMNPTKYIKNLGAYLLKRDEDGAGNQFEVRLTALLVTPNILGWISADDIFIFFFIIIIIERPRWLSWMRRPTGDQEVAGSTPAEVGNILSWRLIMKYFLRSFSPFRWFKEGSCQFLAKECAQYWLTT